MRKELTLTILLSITILFAFSQEERKLVNKDQFEKLQQLSKDFKVRNDANRKKAFELAAKNNWETFRVEKDGTVISLQGIDDLGFPLYLKTYNNTIAAGTTRTNSLYSGGSLGLTLNGSSNNLIGKIGIWDGGSVYSTHQEFEGGRIEQKDSPSAGSEHSTHVAGTMMASGVYPIARGMAWGLKKLYAYDFSSDITEMTTAASNGMAISNHSYGFIAGWNYNSTTTPARWEWNGAFNATEDYKFGFYDDKTRDWDIICYNAPYYLPVKSAGNNRTENGPALGSLYYGYESATSSAIVSKGNRPSGISNNDGYDIISTTGTAKNILTVGATFGLPFGSSDQSQVIIAPFSSWGPTDDGRIKPDIVADGVGVTSTSNTDTKAYSRLSGTSMSAPNVSGSLALLQEYYSQLNQSNFMKSATIKGLVIETADEAGTTSGPDYIFGWGLLNMERAASLIKQNGTTSIISEKSLSQGGISTLQVTTSGYGPLRVTICWTDPEGTATAPGTLNSRTPKLVNDLDLRLIKGSTTYLPFILNPNNPTLAASNGDNILDNVEQIYIPDAAPGQTYTIQVSHKGTLTKGPQNYSIIASGIGGKTYCTSIPSSSNDSRIEQFQLNTINNTLPNTCRTYSDFTNLATNLEAGKTYPFTVNIGTCGADFAKIAKIYIDWNSDGDFDDNNESVATSNSISSTGVFSGNLSVPTDIIVGNSSLLRIVLSETTSNITACGSYAKGETQDYTVKFTKPSIDAGVIAFNNINDNLCATLEQSVSIKLKNFGSTTLTSIPITVTLSNNSTVLKTITENYTGNLAPNNEVDYQLNGFISTETAKQYIIDAKTTLTADALVSNNSSTKTFNILALQAPKALSASICDNVAGYYQLNGQGDGTLFWYTSTNSKVPIAVGANPYTTIAPTNNTYYVGVNDFKTSFGAVNKKQYSGGTYSGNFGPKPIITITVPMVLDSALLYSSQAGQITFTVETTSGLVVSSSTIDVVRTKTSTDVTNSASQIEDDVNDPGKIYKLGLVFPAAGTYRIGISYSGGATIFRSNAGVTDVPMNSAGNILTLAGAYFDGSGTPTTITSSYYYLYNMLFKSLGCTNYSRTAVSIIKPVITQTGSTLNSNFESLNQWYLNNVLINGATSKTYNPTVSGTYRIDILNPSGCTNSSTDFSYVFSSIKPSDASEIGLKVYPIPTNDFLNLSFNVLNKENISISLTNLIGQEVYTKQRENFSGKYTESLNLQNFNDGIYILKIKIGTKYYSQKITLFK